MEEVGCEAVVSRVAAEKSSPRLAHMAAKLLLVPAGATVNNTQHHTVTVSNSGIMEMEEFNKNKKKVIQYTQES